MSTDFWLGLAALPVAAALIALLAFAVYGLFFIAWKNEYVLGPKRYPDGYNLRGRIMARARILRTVADMGHVYRIFYFYGWTLMIGRQPKGESRRPPRVVFEDEDGNRDPFWTLLEDHYGVKSDD